MSNKIDKISLLGEKIIQAIKDQRLTKKYLYNKMGISRGTLDNWISGETVPNFNEVEAMSKILGINLLQKDNPKEKFDKDVVNEPLTHELWQEVKITNKSYREEIERLWSLVDRLAPKSGLNRIPTEKR